MQRTLLSALFFLSCLVQLAIGGSTDARTTTFTSATTGVTFGNSGVASTYPWQVTVSGVTEQVREIRVRLTSMTATNASHLDICLVDPVGNKTMLMSDGGEAQTFPGITNSTMQFSDWYSSRADWNSFAGGNGFGDTVHPFNENTSSDSFPSPFPGAPYTGPFGNFMLAATNGDVNGTWSLYIVNDGVGNGGSTTTCTANQFIVEFATIVTSIVPQNFYVSTSGSTGNDGLTPGTPWPFQYALTNRSYCTGDKINMLPGIYTGISGLSLSGIGVVPGGTNSFAFRPPFVTNNALTMADYVHIQPYQRGRVRVDTRTISFNAGPIYLHDIEFIDSTVTSRTAADANRITTDFQSPMTGWDARVDHLIIGPVSTCPGACYVAIGNTSMYQGQEFHEHGVYAQSTVPYLFPIFRNNCEMFPGGSAMKLINGAYNFTCASNIIINSGRSTAANGFAINFWHNPGQGFYEAAPPKVYRNYFVSDTGGSTVVEDFAIGLGIGVGQNYSSGRSGGQIHFFNNYVLGPDRRHMEFGASANDGYLYNSVIKSNIFANNSSAQIAFVTRTPTQDATLDMDYNTYISSLASGGLSWQWNGSGFVSTLATWTNATTGGPGGKLDINSTVTFSDTTFGGDKVEVYADPLETGRGHVLIVNNTGAGSKNVDLTPLGLSDGQKYLLTYTQSLTNEAKWVTNTFTAASPNLSFTLTSVAWPKDLPPTTPQTPPEGLPPDSLPKIGAWLVMPAPFSPTPTVVTNVGRTQMTVSWTLPSNAYGARVYMRSNSSAWRILQTVDAPTTSLVVPIASAQTNEFSLSAYNGYVENAQGTASKDPISGGLNLFKRFLRFWRRA